MDRLGSSLDPVSTTGRWTFQCVTHTMPWAFKMQMAIPVLIKVLPCTLRIHQWLNFFANAREIIRMTELTMILAVVVTRVERVQRLEW